MPTNGNPKLTIRMDEEKRARFIAAAYNAGTTGADLVNEFIDQWLGKDGAERATASQPAESDAPYLRELPTGLVDLEADDSARCIHCGRQALLYALDAPQNQWFTCLDHHGLVMAKLLRGELDGQTPPLPPL